MGNAVVTLIPGGVRTAAQKEQLGIAGFGISVTTMEEVFIKVGEGTDETLDERCHAVYTVL